MKRQEFEEEFEHHTNHDMLPPEKTDWFFYVCIVTALVVSLMALVVIAFNVFK